MTIDQVVDEYAEELGNWNFFSDSQRAYVDEILSFMWKGIILIKNQPPSQSGR